MSRIFTITPIDGWQPGDRAYCVHGTQRTIPTLEVGKIYRIADVIPMRGMTDAGVQLEGVVIPDGSQGISSARFVKLRAGGHAPAQIAASTSPSWSDAYRRSVGQTARP